MADPSWHCNPAVLGLGEALFQELGCPCPPHPPGTWQRGRLGSAALAFLVIPVPTWWLACKGCYLLTTD